GGLHGTAMVGWEVPDRKLDEIIQYIKTRSPKWQEDDAVGEPAAVPPDPWGEARQTQAVERGKVLYHGFAQCLGCHPAYATRQYIYDASKATLGTGTTDFRVDMYQPEIKDSEYGVKILPPDFLFNELRSIDKGTELHDLYRILVAGVTGAAMPAWNPVTLPNKEADVYAIAWWPGPDPWFMGLAPALGLLGCGAALLGVFMERFRGGWARLLLSVIAAALAIAGLAYLHDASAARAIVAYLAPAALLFAAAG